jgi:hypothetical protein
MNFRQIGIGLVVALLCVAVMFGALSSVSHADYTTISVQSITLDGITPVYSDAVSGGFQFVNDGRVFLHAKNTSGAAVYITVTTPATLGGLDVADVYVTVDATTGDEMVGPFATGIFNNSGGYVYVSNSATTDVSMAAVKLP